MRDLREMLAESPEADARVAMRPLCDLLDPLGSLPFNETGDFGESSIEL